MIPERIKDDVAQTSNIAMFNDRYWGNTPNNNCLPVACRVRSALAKKGYPNTRLVIGQVQWPALARNGYAGWDAPTQDTRDALARFAKEGGIDPGGWHAWVEDLSGDRIDATLHNTLPAVICEEPIVKASGLLTIQWYCLQTPDAAKNGLIYHPILTSLEETQAFLYFVVEGRNREMPGCKKWAPKTHRPIWRDEQEPQRLAAPADGIFQRILRWLFSL